MLLGGNKFGIPSKILNINLHFSFMQLRVPDITSSPSALSIFNDKSSLHIGQAKISINVFFIMIL
tara:strand:+ start:15912 stop:16106 length:195 start_codon:yes stop_codon:yes gene_type:complete